MVFRRAEEGVSFQQGRRQTGCSSKKKEERGVQQVQRRKGALSRAGQDRGCIQQGKGKGVQQDKWIVWRWLRFMGATDRKMRQCTGPT